MTAVPPHPFTLLAVAAGLPALAWILPAPWGAAAMLAIAIGLCLTPGGSPGITEGSLRPGLVLARTALFTAAPFWLFLFLLHDPARAVALGLRITTMIVISI